MQELTTKQELLIGHKIAWGGCKKCAIGRTACQHVLLWESDKLTERTDVLFVGEAPGESEDASGIPFLGRIGKLLREVIKLTILEGMTYAITNTIACRPTDTLGGNRKPTKQELANCSDRLKEIIKIVKPKMIVCLGLVSAEAVCKPEVDYKGRIFRTYPPAYILYKGGKTSPEYAVYLKNFKDMFRQARSLR